MKILQQLEYNSVRELGIRLAAKKFCAFDLKRPTKDSVKFIERVEKIDTRVAKYEDELLKMQEAFKCLKAIVPTGPRDPKSLEWKSYLLMRHIS